MPCSLYLSSVLGHLSIATGFMLLITAFSIPLLWTFADFFVVEGFPARRILRYMLILLSIYILLPDTAVYAKMCQFN